VKKGGKEKEEEGRRRELLELSLKTTQNSLSLFYFHPLLHHSFIHILSNNIKIDE